MEQERFTAAEAVEKGLWPASEGALYDEASRAGMPAGETVQRIRSLTSRSGVRFDRVFASKGWTADELQELVQSAAAHSAKIRGAIKRMAARTAQQQPEALTDALAELCNGEPDTSDPVLVAPAGEPTPLQNLRLALDNLRRAQQWASDALDCVLQDADARHDADVAARMRAIADQLDGRGRA